MISFLNTALLYILPAILIPLLIHLFTQKKLKKIPFSSLAFLKEMRKERIRRIKIKQILLIILRMLIVLFLVLTFARPALKVTPSAGKIIANARSSIVIILDNSLSMSRLIDGTPAFEYVKKRAFEVVNLLKPGDEVFIIYPLKPGKIQLIGPKYNFESINLTIQSTPLAYQATDLTTAIQLAKETLSNSTNINREIFLISDLQRYGFNQNSPAILPVDSDIRFFYLPVTNSAYRNVALQSVEIVNQILEKGKTAEIAVNIINFGDDPEQNKLVQLLLNGKRVAQTTVNLDAKTAKQVTFKFTPDQVGFQSGTVLLEEDDLARDNQRYFTFYVPEEIKILLVGNQLTDVNNFKWAINPSDELVSTLKADILLADQLRTVDLNKYQAIVLSNIPSLASVVEKKIINFISQGGGVVLVPGSEMNIREYSASFNKKLKIPPFTESVGQMGNTEAFTSFNKIDFDHPIFKSLFESEEKNVESPHFYFSFKMPPTKETETIIQLNNNYPFLLSVKYEKGRILIFTSSPDPKWSDWAVKGIFAPLVNRCINYVASSVSFQQEQIYVGNELSYSSSQKTAGIELELEKPDKNRVRVRPLLQQEKMLVNFSETDLPGIYSLYNKNQLMTQWAVNCDPEESDIEMLATEKLSPLIGGKSLTRIEEEDNLETMITQARFGNELWKAFLIIALILMLIEMGLYWERRNPIQNETNPISGELS
ncbi:BatA domain-containing protein [candidate division KSB1 bacterium]|nr:BatA domain-containing protein [candidate division KSB1 bacterium]